MTNAQHSMKSCEHYTPSHIIEMAREVLGSINLDPCSSAAANKVVKAGIFYNSVDEPLDMEWRIPPESSVGAVWCNPPGSRGMRPSLPIQFWEKLIHEVHIGNVLHGIFLAYSLEQLQQCQKEPHFSMLDFPLCIPRKRIAFIGEDGMPQKSPTHANAIIYVPGMVENTTKFKEVFSKLGTVKI